MYFRFFELNGRNTAIYVIIGDKIMRELFCCFKTCYLFLRKPYRLLQLDVCKQLGASQESVVWLGQKFFCFDPFSFILAQSSHLNLILHSIFFVSVCIFKITELYHFVFEKGSLVSLDTFLWYL